MIVQRTLMCRNVMINRFPQCETLSDHINCMIIISTNQIHCCTMDDVM